MVGASRLVGAPLSMMLVEEGRACVTICHKYKKDISLFTRQPDILVVAVGKPGIITADMVKARLRLEKTNTQKLNLYEAESISRGRVAP